MTSRCKHNRQLPTSNQSIGDIGISVEVVLEDFDGDGDLNAYVTQTNGWGDKIWLNNGKGIFTDSRGAIALLMHGVGHRPLHIHASLRKEGGVRQCYYEVPAEESPTSNILKL
jgi:hypothetical protein